MGKKLMIVESPAKAKTIEKYLGGEFTVKSSFGHIRDLDKGNNGIDIEKDFQPNYVVSPEKTKVVRELKQLASRSEEVWLATDEDREGEAISWHLCEVLDLEPLATPRIVFNEITKKAIQKAVQNPRRLDLNLVNAQQARRVLDRLVGFELSELLWRKVRSGLSAGRVQSVAVKLIVEREREIQKFEAENYYKVTAEFTVEGASGQPTILKAELKRRLKDKAEAKDLLNSLKSAVYSISAIEKRPLKRKPAPPFTTSTLQQDASRKLGFAVRRTMSTAQRLYEQGHITYMRTDSISLSDQAVGDICSRIETEYGSEYVQARKYKSKDKNAQEAHEAIRPTDINVSQAGSDGDQQRLYDLIRKRAMASQMAEARIEKTIVDIVNDKVSSDEFKAEGEVLLFDGFLKVYLESTDDEEEEAKGMLPPLKQGQVLDLNLVQAMERFTRPPSRYTEASLVKKLEELGIGRPSTYAPTISKIMEQGRGYVSKESREGVERSYEVMVLNPDDSVDEEVKTEVTGSTSNRLYAKDIGMLVSDFLQEHFEDVMEYSFTADIEKQFDKIAGGQGEWRKMVGDFYKPFHAQVQETLEQSGRARGRRDLGVDAESGHTVLAQMTRYGPVVQIGTREEVGEDGKPKFANLRPGQSLETITFEEAMELFKLPKDLGEYDGEPVAVNTGRYGPYVKWGDKFINIPRKMVADPLDITMEQAEELIKAKIKEDTPIARYEGEPLTKGKGRFGPFIKWKNLYVNIPKRIDAELITPDEALELLKAKIEKEANRYIHQWPEEKISVENGRWGPFIKFKKKNISIPKKDDGSRVSSEEAKDMNLEDVKAIIEKEMPGSFSKNGKKAKS
jgi:DNA topoisomerase-1